MQRRVHSPAIALIVAASFSMLWSLFLVTLRIFGTTFSSVFSDLPSVGDVISGTMGAALAGVDLGISAFIFYAGLKMMNMEKWQICLIGALLSIVSIIPYLGGCCCLKFPVGVWATIVLLLPDTRPAFSS